MNNIFVTMLLFVVILLNIVNQPKFYKGDCIQLTNSASVNIDAICYAMISSDRLNKEYCKTDGYCYVIDKLECDNQNVDTSNMLIYVGEESIITSKTCPIDEKSIQPTRVHGTH